MKHVDSDDALNELMRMKRLLIGNDDEVFMHKDLAAGRWFTFSLVEQLANVGSEISRTISWKQKGDLTQSKAAFYRALELIHLTIIDPKNKGRRKEVLRARELLIDHFMYDNEYKTTDESWNKYFYEFGFAAALKRRRQPRPV